MYLKCNAVNNNPQSMHGVGNTLSVSILACFVLFCTIIRDTMQGVMKLISLRFNLCMFMFCIKSDSLIYGTWGSVVVKALRY